jgi:hypothetical protein
METIVATSSKQSHSLLGIWDLYFHLPQDKQWDIKSYNIIARDISTAERAIVLNESLPEKVIKYCMLFIMRKGVTPMWEDPANCNGGCFSFKVLNKSVHSVWKELFYAVCGETLFLNKSHNKLLTGITISPKRNFCVIKVWLGDCSIQDPNTMIDISTLSKEGCLFKKHSSATSFVKR